MSKPEYLFVVGSLNPRLGWSSFTPMIALPRAFILSKVGEPPIAALDATGACEPPAPVLVSLDDLHPASTTISTTAIGRRVEVSRLAFIGCSIHMAGIGCSNQWLRIF